MKRIRHSLFTTIAAGGLALALAACAGDAPTAPGKPSTPALPPSFDRAAATVANPSLLACPVDTSASASAVIDRRGGKISVGNFSLRVPPHAVRTPTLITFNVPASPYLEVEIHAAGTQHYQFERSVRIVLDYSRCANSVRPSTLDAWYIDSSTKSMITPMRGFNDRGRERLVFWTDHLSGYALAD